MEATDLMTPVQKERRIGTPGQRGGEKFILLFEGNPLPVSVQGRDGRVTDVNGAFLDTFRCSKEEIIGKLFTETDLPAEPADTRVLDEILHADTPYVKQELRMRRKDGVILDCLVSGSPVIDQRRKYILTVFIDESERKRALRDREEEEAWQRFLVDISEDVVWMMDLVTMRLLRISPAVEKLLGFTAEESIMRTMEEAFTRECLERAMQIFADGVQLEMSGLGDVNRSWKLEMEAYHKNGRVIPLEITYWLLRDKDGTPKFIAAKAREKTAKKLSEAPGENSVNRSMQTQKEESLERMAGAIAHNFNNLLTVVQGNLELAGFLLPKGSPSEERLAEAMKAVRRAADISSLMLTYVGKSMDSLEPMDLSEVCRRCLPLLKDSYRDILLIADFPLPGPFVKANASHIERILTNLVANATESLSDGRKHVEISISTVTASAISPRHCFPTGWEPTAMLYACLSVRDEGCGITENAMEKLFDPFYTSKFTGRGLGLPVVLGTVRAKSGCVTVESEPGRGSVFRVYLPVIGGGIPSQTRPPERLPGESIPKGTVLLVDDETDVRQMARAMLEHLGLTVIEAKDGREALEVFRRNRHEIHCVISDLTMPGMGGWEFIEALRLIVPGMPVILSSGYDQDQIMAGGHKELPQAFLGKPYNLKGLKEGIRLALEG